VAADHVIDRYARDVLDGGLPAGQFHKLACARHERDRAREATAAFPYRLDTARADRFYRFASQLQHYKGEWNGQRVQLQPHQQFRLGSLLAWVHCDTQLRRFRTSYTEIPRKNGKTFEAAIVALYLAFFDSEPGAEGYCIATKREQAKIVFADCKRMVSASSPLHARIKILVGNLNRSATASKLEPLGADDDSMDGLNPHVVIIDEAHAMKTRGLIDVMETAVGARRQPLIYWITTAGTDSVSPCGDQHEYCCNILKQTIDDESTFVFIAHADADDFPFEDATFRKANPNYGVSVKPDDLRAMAFKAIQMPAAAAAFKRTRLNLWNNAYAPWLSIDGWRKGQSHWTAADMAGEVCWLGVDLSSKIDLTAIVAAFPPTDTRRSWRLLVWCLTPEDTLDERAHRDRAPYALYRERGWLRTNAGNRIDQDVVIEMVRDAAARFDVQQIGIDPWNAGNLGKVLTDDGFQVVEINQTLQQMSAPAKDFEADVLDGLVDAGHNELMAWCVGNVVVVADNKDNIYPVKRRSRGRIDPVIAALMARKLAALDTTEQPADDPDLVTA
jgi:phage terminase large subunit-like protein